jgi:2-amino-4-hydroxy-6-hydroxymethyldihydropteridine diphosphokinase
MTLAFVGLGANLGDPVRTLRLAVRALDGLPGSRCIGVSPWYRNPPVGPRDQPDYVNAVAVLRTRLGPRRLLAWLQRIELRHGRVRGQRWGPRTLDLDLLVFGAVRLASRHLHLPHPRIQERSFVLYPLHDLAPRLVIPGRGRLPPWLLRNPPRLLRRLRPGPGSLQRVAGRGCPNGSLRPASPAGGRL